MKMLLLMAAVLAGAAPAPIKMTAAHMATEYAEICLQAFPDAQAMTAAVERRGATAMPALTLKVTLGDDPGRGWELRDGGRHMTERGGEQLMVIDRHVVDAAKLTPGTVATPPRFVHQIKAIE